MKTVLIILILFALCFVAKAATWDIGAVQLEGGATDIGAVQATAAIGAVPQVIIILDMD